MQYLFSIVILFIMTGCASKNIQSAADGEKNQNPVSIGYSEKLGRTIAANDRLVFFRIQFTDGTVRVTEIATSMLKPKSSSEEVLAYSRNLRLIGPAYGSYDGFTDNSGFICSAWSSKMKDLYHPCGTGSRFVGINKSGSTVRNIVATPLTWGLAAGLNYEIDFENLSKVVEQLQLTSLANRTWQSVELVNKLNGNLSAIAKNVSATATTKIHVINGTGFTHPTLHTSLAGINLDHTQQVTGIDSLTYEGDSSVFAAIDAKSNAQFENINSSRKFRVRCMNSVIQTSGFSGSITCPNTFTYFDPKDVLSLTYKLDSYSPGTRFPTLSGRDKSLSLKVEGGAIYLVNETNTFVEVKSITIYGGKEVNDTKVELSFAPMSSNRTPFLINDYASTSIIQMFTFNRVKVSDIAGKTRLFGVAIKYRVGNDRNFETLFIKRDVLLSSLI